MSYGGIQAKIEISSFGPIAVGFLLQTGAKSPKKFPHRERKQIWLGAHTQKSAAQKEVLFLVVFANENYAEPQASVSSVPFNSP